MPADGETIRSQKSDGQTQRCHSDENAVKWRNFPSLWCEAHSIGGRSMNGAVKKWDHHFFRSPFVYDFFIFRKLTYGRFWGIIWVMNSKGKKEIG